MKKLQKGNSLIMVLGVLAVIAIVFVGDDVLKSLSNSFAKSELGQTIARGGKGGGSGSGGNPKGTPGATVEPSGNPPPPGGNPPPPPGGGNPTPTPVGTPNGDSPYPGAPLCPDSGANHDNTKFHTLWDSVRHCHYDHEHGVNPFTTAVANTFPGFNLKTLIGNVEVGHTNLSSPLENTLKHGGFKWNTQLVNPEPCFGFESTRNGTNASVVEYHGFGNEAIENEARIHTALVLARQCNVANPTDYGYVFTIQFQDYGQRIVPYQGTVMPYPNQPVPAYNSSLGPYLSFDCVGPAIQCRRSLSDVISNRRAVASNWASKPNGQANTRNPFGSKIFTLLFRLGDGYRLFDWNDQTYPFTFLWVCSSDDGRTYNPAGCRYNNSTTQVAEIAGNVPAEWDNKPGFDTDNRVGRVTAEGYVTRFGGLNTTCTTRSSEADCFPIKMVNAFVGTWGSVLQYTTGKGTNVVSHRDGDIYFCNGRVCNASDSGATPSGWIGQNN